MNRQFLVLASALVLAGCVDSREPPVVTWKPALATEPVPNDPDDPAIWIHPTNPVLSVVICTNKVAAPAGALVVFDLQGKILQTISGLDRPNNVDLRQGVRLGDRTLDLVAATERNKSTLRFYVIDAETRRLAEFGSARVFEGEEGDHAA
ncbi:MAG: phytase, partial [Longimicrobiales bacterium]